MNKVKYEKKLEDIFFAICHLKEVFENHCEYEKYHQEFEFIFIKRLLHDASLRFFEFKEGRASNDRIAQMIKKEYPTWRTNKYYKRERLKYKIVCRLFAEKQYKILDIILKRGHE